MSAIYRIEVRSELEPRTLEIRPDRVVFADLASEDVREFGLDEIFGVVMSAQGVLSFQVGEEIFRVPAAPSDPDDAAAIGALVEALRATATAR